MPVKGFLFLLFYCLTFNYLVLHAPITIFTPPDVSPIQQVAFVEHQAESPNVLDNKNWHPITLPDDWYDNHQDVQQLWYRAELNLNQSDLILKANDVWAVYLPSVTHNAAVYINGYWVGQGGDFSEPVSRHHNQPQLFSFSSALLQQEENQIDVRVKAAFYEQGLFDQFYIAPVEQLQNAYDWKQFIRIELVQWFTMVMYVFSLVLLVFWLSRPHEGIYGLFSLELFIWASHNLNLFIENIPVSARLWEIMTISTLGWTVALIIFFNHRLVGNGNLKIEKLIWFFLVMGLGLFFLPDIDSVLHIGYRIWDLFIMFFGIYAIYYLLLEYRLNQQRDVFLMIVVGIPILSFGFHDILMINHLGDRRDGLTMQYSVIPSVILFSWFLVRRFVQSIAEAEKLAETLEQRVQSKQQELKLQYEKLHLMQRESLLSEERERIMRDMHDGIGGQLISVITFLQGYSDDVFVRIREKVQLSLIDLRFVIDSLDPLLNDLPTLLGMMRMRLADQLDAANIELKWAVTELPEIKNMTPYLSLHIMRIVQEAITNSIKHSHSKIIMIATGVSKDKQQVYIDIIDYGDGFDSSIESANQHSRGLKNMNYRAGQLNTELQITSSSEGTSVRLSILIDGKVE